MERILILGSSGLVGSRFLELQANEFDLVAPSHHELDLLDQSQVSDFLNHLDCSFIVNFVAFTKVDEAEQQKGDRTGLAFQLNSLVPQILANACKKSNRRLLHVSTDYIFDGQKANSPYTEKDRPNPLNWYGETKWIGDQAVLESGCDYTLARIEMPYTAFYPVRKDIARFLLEKMQTNQIVTAIPDQRITPNYLDALIEALVCLIKNPQSGVFNLASTDWTTPFDFTKLIAETFGLDESLVTKISFEEYQKGRPTPRPRHPWLDVSKFEKEYGKGILVSNKEGLRRFKKQIDDIH